MRFADVNKMMSSAELKLTLASLTDSSSLCIMDDDWKGGRMNLETGKEYGGIQNVDDPKWYTNKSVEVFRKTVIMSL